MTSRRLRTESLELITATAQHLLVELEDIQKLGRLLAAEVPEDWPPPLLDEAALRYTLDQLHKGPTQLGWWMRYVVKRAGGRPVLLGVVGLKGPPRDGAVEIGYGIVASQQRQGFATEAARGLVDWAFEQENVERVIAHTMEGDPASGGVLKAIGFVEDGSGPEPGTARWSKTREAWVAEGPPSRAVPRLATPPADAPITGLPPVAREVFERLMNEPLREPGALRAEVKEYVQHVVRHAETNPYVDDMLARDIARICEALFDAVNESTPEHIRRQIQAVARYFVTESDGDSDLSIGGLDEDAAVANAVAEHLGRGDLVSEIL